MKRQAEKGGRLVELAQPEDVRALLMDPERHWKDGRSAAELTYAWWAGVPRAVGETLATDALLREVACERIVFEKKSRVPAAGGATRTDLVAYLRTPAEAVVAAVEAKAGESFDAVCRDWLRRGKGVRSGANRGRRFVALCELVGCEPATAMELRYQLFVRVAAAVCEAKSAGADRAVVLAHSFDEAACGAEDFVRFASAIGLALDGLGALSDPRVVGGVRLQLGWARDRARAAA